MQGGAATKRAGRLFVLQSVIKVASWCLKLWIGFGFAVTFLRRAN